MTKRVILLRHGMTAGNREGRYIGRTDEPLCPEGIALVSSSGFKRLFKEQVHTGELSLIVSPMTRCLQTAALLLGADGNMIKDPGKVGAVLHTLAGNIDLKVDEGLRECDFGRFEGKNYRELTGDPDYQSWIESGGVMTFPGGENPDSFKDRCCSAFAGLALSFRETAVLVVHGGTIMSILERYGRDFDGKKKPFYDWHTGSGEGFEAELSFIKKGEPLLQVKPGKR